jgi:acetyl-CoA carboxylase carboxyltransferase component
MSSTNISKMFITGPEVVKTVLGEDLHGRPRRRPRAGRNGGNAHFFSNSEAGVLRADPHAVSYLPDNSRNKAAIIEQKKPKPLRDIEELHPEGFQDAVRRARHRPLRWSTTPSS